MKDGSGQSEATYQLLDNMFKSANFSLRMVNLTQHALTLNLFIDYENKEASIKGDLMELNYVEMKKIDYSKGFLIFDTR